MFESKPDPQLEELKKLLTDVITLQKDLLAKLQTQNTALTSLARFVSENAASKPVCGVI